MKNLVQKLKYGLKNNKIKINRTKKYLYKKLLKQKE